jgi:hypothetical protein
VQGPWGNFLEISVEFARGRRKDGAGHGPSRSRTLVLASLALGAWGSAPFPAAAQALSRDPFVAEVAGEWQGHGEYEGNPLTLTRSWTIELGGQFLRADMRVGMSNGSSFGALMYWRHVSPGVYDVVWMDGIGRQQSLRATRDPSTTQRSATTSPPWPRVSSHR